MIGKKGAVLLLGHVTVHKGARRAGVLQIVHVTTPVAIVLLWENLLTCVILALQCADSVVYLKDKQP